MLLYILCASLASLSLINLESYLTFLCILSKVCQAKVWPICSYCSELLHWCVLPRMSPEFHQRFRSDMTPSLPVWAMKLNKDSGQQVCLAVIQNPARGAENWGFLPLHVLRVSEMWQALWTEESGALLLLGNDCSWGFIELFWTCTSLVNIGSYQRLGWCLIRSGGDCTAHDRPLSNKCQCVLQILWILVMTAPPPPAIHTLLGVPQMGRRDPPSMENHRVITKLPASSQLSPLWIINPFWEDQPPC